MTPQVKKDLYGSPRYLSRTRFCSYGYQFSEITRLEPTNVLEIGIGNGIVSFALRRAGVKVTTLDFAPDLEPDVVASVTKLPFDDNSFDVVACFEVLEHIPWEQVPRALEQIQRVCQRYAVISLPDVARYLRMHIHGFLWRRFYENPFYRRRKHVFDGQHHWEINKKGYELRRVIHYMTEAGFRVEHSYRAWDIPHHRFFRLRKDADG